MGNKLAEYFYRRCFCQYSQLPITHTNYADDSTYSVPAYAYAYAKATAR